MPEYRRKLPHQHPDDSWLFVTWRLFGSVPGRMSATAHPTAGHAFVAQDRVLDRCESGPLSLQDHRVADLVSRAIVVGECEREFYRLRAWVVMPNHVHLLILPLVRVPVLMRWLKGSTARGSNVIPGRTGRPFWQDESFDHYLRTEWQIERTVMYIERNPVSAGLVGSEKQWRWSSAGWRAKTACPTLQLPGFIGRCAGG